MRVLFLGTPDFAVPSLDALLRGPDEVAAVVTPPDRPSGRGRRLERPAVARRAKERGVPLLQPERLHSPETLAILRDLGIDLAVTCAFGRLLRQSLLDLPRLGCLNVHASLLPRHRGAAPIPRAILEGDGWTGITIFRLDAGMDTGPILLQRMEPIGRDDTTGSLTARLATLGGEALREACDRLRDGTAAFRPQEEERATYAPTLAKEDGRCSFSRPADQVDRFVRAMHPWPGATCRFRAEPLKILHVEPLDLVPRDDPPGTFLPGAEPVVAARPGRVRLRVVQPAGKKEMDAASWARGARIEPGERLDG
ncbi:MAG: methionyl-tRNA formyltransferase [Candidatus Eisenbacteria bacterium]